MKKRRSLGTCWFRHRPGRYFGFSIITGQKKTVPANVRIVTVEAVIFCLVNNRISKTFTGQLVGFMAG